MAPPKPWEPELTPQRQAEQSAIPTDRYRGSVMGGEIANTGGGSYPPPVPPRPPPSGTAAASLLNSSYNNYGYNGMGTFTNPYYGNSMGVSSNYYGGYGSRFYQPGSVGYQDTDFVRLAEEQSRGAFQSVESVVQAFASVSMMLESTLNAIYSSFRAVLGVADQFSRLKAQFSHVVTTLAVVRFLRFLWRRLLVLMRLRPGGYADQVWIRAAADQAPTAAQLLSAHGGAANAKLASAGGANWPAVVFFAFAIGGPYIIWRLVAKLVATVEDQKRWATGEQPHFVAVALYDFAANSNGELSIRAGQQIRLAPKELQPAVRGWILGSIDGSSIGLVPANYIKILGKRDGNETARTNAVHSSPMSSASLEAEFENLRAGDFGNK